MAMRTSYPSADRPSPRAFATFVSSSMTRMRTMSATRRAKGLYRRRPCPAPDVAVRKSSGDFDALVLHPPATRGGTGNVRKEHGGASARKFGGVRRGGNGEDLELPDREGR